MLAQVQAALTESFVQAIRRTFLFGISFAVIAGVVGWILVPKRQRQEQATSLGGVEIVSVATVSANGLSANGVSPNGSREVAPVARTMASTKAQKSDVP